MRIRRGVYKKYKRFLSNKFFMLFITVIVFGLVVVLASDVIFQNGGLETFKCPDLK